MVEANEWFNSISNKLPETIHVTIENYLDNKYESEVKKANKLKTVDTKIQRLKKLNDLKSDEKRQLEEDFRNIEAIVEKLYYKIFDFISNKNEANLNMKLEKLLEILKVFPQDKKKVIIDELEFEINKQKKVIKKEYNKTKDENLKIERSLNLQEIKVGEMMSNFNPKNIKIKEEQNFLSEAFRNCIENEEHD